MIFVVLAQTNPQAVANAVRRVFPVQHLELAADQFLVAAGGSAQSVAVQLGVDDSGSLGYVVVLSVSGYWGWHDNSVWEWIAANWARVG